MNPYKSLHEKLLAYPRKRLTMETSYSSALDCHCAMGAIAHVDGQEFNVNYFTCVGRGSAVFHTDAVAQWAAGLGVTAEDVAIVQILNDCGYRFVDPDARYVRMLSALARLGALDEEGVAAVRTTYERRTSAVGCARQILEKIL